MITRGSLTLASAAGGALLLMATQAAAHAHLVSSSPAANATVAAPKIITLTFNEKLAPAFSAFKVAMTDGREMPVKTTVSKDRKTITGAPGGAFMPGAYTVTWNAASADGHRMSGTLTFKVK